MTGIVDSISNLIASIFDVFRGILNTILASLQGVVSLAATLVQDVALLAKGAVEFVLGNIVIIGVLVAALVGYSVYQQRRGNVKGGSTTRAKLS